MMSVLLTAYKAKFYAACCVVLLLLSILSGSSNIVLVGVFAFVLILSIWTNNGIRLNTIDMAVLLIFVYEIILGNTLYGRNNSLIPILTQFIFTAFYFIIRLSARERGTVKMVLKWSSIFFIVSSLFCVVSFLMFRGKVLSAGFNVLSDFKFLYRPFGNLNNVWATFLLCFWLIYLLCALFYSARNRLVGWGLASLPLLYCLIVSFSRGIYICVGVILIGLLLSLLFSRKFNTRFKISSIAVALLSLSTLALLHKKEFIQTVKITETVSQQRSLDHRVSSLLYIKPLLQEIPIYGVGTGNYSMAIDKYVYQDSNNSYTNVAPNILSQLLIEKGIAGTILWGLLIIIVLASFRHTDVKSQRQQLSILFALAVIFLRELSFPSLLIMLGLQLILALLMGIYANNLVVKMKDGKPRRILYAATVLVIFAYCAILNNRYVAHKANISNFKENLEKGRYDEARACLVQCRKTAPMVAYKALLHKKKYLATSDDREIEMACEYMWYAVKENPFNVRLQYDYAMILYLAGQTCQATSMLKELSDSFPNNSLMHATLGNIFYNVGDNNSAIPHFAKAIELTPSILETKSWQRFKATDSLSCSLIISRIESDLQKIEENPIKLAKFGKIMYLVGRYDVAKDLLHQALSALPNLQSPWNSLWEMALMEDDSRAEDYSRKVSLWGTKKNTDIQQECISFVSENEPLPANQEFYDSYYIYKFRDWYATEWYPEISVF